MFFFLLSFYYYSSSNNISLSNFQNIRLCLCALSLVLCLCCSNSGVGLSSCKENFHFELNYLVGISSNPCTLYCSLLLFCYIIKSESIMYLGIRWKLCFSNILNMPDAALVVGMRGKFMFVCILNVIFLNISLREIVSIEDYS